MFLNDKTVGTCSICGGPVVVPTFYWSTIPPVPTCSQCGATPAHPAHGPIIKMQRNPNQVRLSENTHDL
jgi:hypothetical protein